MAVDGCVKAVPFDSDSDDDKPLSFKRSSIVSRSKPAAQNSSTRKDTSAQASNGQTLNSTKTSVASTLKQSSKPSPESSKPRPLVSAKPEQSLDQKHNHGTVEKNKLQRPHASNLSGAASCSRDKSKLGETLGKSVLKSEPSVDNEGVGPIVARSSVNNTHRREDKLPAKDCSDDDDSDDDDDKPISTMSSLKIRDKSCPDKQSGNTPSNNKGQLQNTGSSGVSKVGMASGKAKVENSDDSDDDKPLNARFCYTAARVSTEQSAKVALSNQKQGGNDADDSEDEKPLSSRYPAKSIGGTSTSNSRASSNQQKADSQVKREPNGEFLSPKNVNKRPSNAIGNTSSANKKARLSDGSISEKVKSESSVKAEMEAEDSDDVPLSQRLKKGEPSSSKSSVNVVKKKALAINKDGKKIKKTVTSSQFSKTLKVPPGSGGGQKWTTLEHNGVVFPPPYKPHGIKMLYNGKPVDLTAEQEEVATMFAVMKDTDYAAKPKFVENFFNDWRQILGKNHVIKKFELCDFTPIYEWHLKEKEKKKQMSLEERKALKEEKLKVEEKYMWAVVDGKKEKVGNFRVEPPGLFRGRGEHPKMGKLKRRIRPCDITINIGKGAAVPECPIPGERWKEVRHDNTVTWLAYWLDPINKKDFKYVFLAASSSLKGQSDKEKYEKSRLLKQYIDNIRRNYTRDFTSKDPTKRQIAVATYLIDKLALRAGNEKDDDEADTVGCCTLKVENVVCEPPNKLSFDFLGKDSIRYKNTVEVELPVYKAIEEFRSGKKSDGKRKSNGDDLFDMLDTSKLNAHLRELMPGLTAKVFRTYNASITLDGILNRETDDDVAVIEKIAVYQRANKEVAIICNHQRSVSKSHESQMSRLNEKIEDLKAQKEELQTDLNRARKNLTPLKDKDGKPKKNLSTETLERKLQQIDEKINKMEKDKEIKEDLKTVALGTSKINYLDPRITVAWCKRHEVPIEKIFNKSLIAKFTWAMDVDPSFRF